MITFNLKKEWFDKIKSGEKTHEYREVKPYWNLCFLNVENIDDYYPSAIPDLLDEHKRRIIYFKCGYPKANDKEKILKAKIKQITIINGKDTDLKIDKPVYDIEFELIKDREVKNG